MARKPRVQDKGMIHHVIVRGNNSQNIFYDDTDRVRYLHLLHRYKNRFQFKILAYCFMDNHIHLLLKQSEIELSRFMAGLQQSYTQYFNSKYDETGHVFEQRFKSFPCSDEAYYLALVAYIHNNPKKAGIVEDAGKYIWSSHIEIINPREDNLCDINELFELIGRDHSSSITEYLWLLGEADDIELKAYYMNSEELEISESSAWIDSREEVINKKVHTIDEMNNIIFQVKKEVFFKMSDYGKIFTIVAINHSLLSNNDIAKYLNIKPTSVSRYKKLYFDCKFHKYLYDVLDKIDEMFYYV